MRRFARSVFLLAVSALFCLFPAISSATTLIVSNTNDVVNGDTSTPTALIANPGTDGISFREAMTAVNGAPGPHTITFDPSLSGKTIELVAAGIPYITVDGVSVIGLTDANGRPTVTIDASTASGVDPFNIFASHFLATGLRFTGLRGNGGESVFSFGAGVAGFPVEISDIRIENNVIDNTGFPDSGHGISFGTDSNSTGAAIRHVWISGNSFIRLQADVDAILGHTFGDYPSIEDINIIGNTFMEDEFGVETAAAGSHARFTGLSIVGNRFLGCVGAIVLTGGGTTLGWPFSTDDLFQGVLIDRNTFIDFPYFAIGIQGGGFELSDSGLVDVKITNNLISPGPDAFLGVGASAGGGLEAVFNRLQNMRLVNNTIVAGNSSFNGLSFGVGYPGNSLSEIEVVNTILAMPDNGDLFVAPGDPLPSFSHCLTNDSRFVGTNGNFSADPLFVDAANGDFHLKPGSPAIGRGTAAGAPCVDLDGLQRHLGEGKVDIGAYEFGAVFSPRPCPIKAITPPQPAPIKGRS